MELVDVIYFTTTTHSSTGYGDYTAKSKIAKLCVSLHHISLILMSVQLFYCVFCRLKQV